MSNLDFNNFIKLLKEEKLSLGEKASIKRSVLNRIESLDPSYSLSWVDRIFITFESHALIASLIVITIFAGTGVSFAAEDALPGDTLYAIKVNINEEVRDVFAVHPENKARWSMEKARRRLLEAEVLAERNELDEEKESALLAKFTKHSEDFDKALESLEREGNVTEALGVIAVAESTLETYRALLASRHVSGESESALLSTLRVEEKEFENATSSVATGTDSIATGTLPSSVSTLVAKRNKNPFLSEVEDSLFRLNEGKRDANDVIANLSEKDLIKATQIAAKSAKSNSDKALRLYDKVSDEIPDDIKTFLEAEINIEATYRTAGDSLVSEKKNADAFTLYQKSINISARLKELLRSGAITSGNLAEVVELLKGQESEEGTVSNILKHSSINLPEPKENPDNGTSSEEVSDEDEVDETSTSTDEDIKQGDRDGSSNLPIRDTDRPLIEISNNLIN
jgi:hypothetical protein